MYNFHDCASTLHTNQPHEVAYSSTEQARVVEAHMLHVMSSNTKSYSSGSPMCEVDSNCAVHLKGGKVPPAVVGPLMTEAFLSCIHSYDVTCPRHTPDLATRVPQQRSAL